MTSHPEPPVAHRVTLAGSGSSFEVAPGERILAAARRAGIWLPFECGWGSCGTCKATVVAGETELLFAQAPSVDARDARRRRVVLCQSTPTSDLTLKVLRAEAEPAPERATADYLARLTARHELAPGIARFGFTLDRPALYRAGQHAVLEVAPGLRRCYSMAGLPGSTEVSFIAKCYPGRPGSQRLFELEVGRQVDLELPYGDSWLRGNERAVVLVAGGTGISAILALATQLATGADPVRAGSGQSPDGRPVRIFYGAASGLELVCWDELQQATAQLPDGRLHAVVATPGSGWTGPIGFVTDLLREQLPTLAEAEFYVAGPPPMVEAVKELLREHCVPLDRVRYDSFG